MFPDISRRMTPGGEVQVRTNGSETTGCAQGTGTAHRDRMVRRTGTLLRARDRDDAALAQVTALEVVGAT
jgi:hypothetical protein